MLYDKLIKPLLFLFPPEKAHHLAMSGLETAVRIPALPALMSGYNKNMNKPVNVAGLNFPNRLGLAAGFDKDGRHVRALADLGFGFIEMGTVTPLPQDGNPKPRLFRLPADQALINRMGFNNEGLQQAVDRLSRLTQRNYILGANIGKNKVTPNEDAVSDYLKGFNALYPWVDYFAVNVSSPNTPGLRELQEKEPLKRILSVIQEVNTSYPQQRPVFLKIAPDLSDAQVMDAADLVSELGISGIIATNTTISREGLATGIGRLENIGQGGLSGKPLLHRSTEVIAALRARMGSSKAIIGVGGIDSAETALEKIKTGADLVQIYTGFIYKGPGLIGEILGALKDK